MPLIKDEKMREPGIQMVGRRVFQAEETTSAKALREKISSVCQRHSQCSRNRVMGRKVRYEVRVVTRVRIMQGFIRLL